MDQLRRGVARKPPSTVLGIAILSALRNSLAKLGGPSPYAGYATAPPRPEGVRSRRGGCSTANARSSVVGAGLDDVEKGFWVPLSDT